MPCERLSSPIFCRIWRSASGLSTWPCFATNFFACWFAQPTQSPRMYGLEYLVWVGRERPEASRQGRRREEVRRAGAGGGGGSAWRGADASGARVRGGAPAAVRVEVGHAAVGLLARDEVAVLAADRDGDLGGLVGDLVADVGARLARADDEHVLVLEDLGLLVVLRVDHEAARRLVLGLPVEARERGPRVGARRDRDRVDGERTLDARARLRPHHLLLARHVVEVLVRVRVLDVLEALLLGARVEVVEHLLALDVLHVGDELLAVAAAEQERRAVRPRERAVLDGHEPLVRLGALDALLDGRAELDVLVQVELVREAVEVVEVLLVRPELGAVLHAVRVVRERGEQRARREHRAVVRLGVHAADADVLLEAHDAVAEARELLHHGQARRARADHRDRLLAIGRRDRLDLGRHRHSLRRADRGAGGMRRV